MTTLLVAQWAKETEAVLVSCVQLARFFGSDSDVDSLTKSFAVFFDLLDTISGPMTSVLPPDLGLAPSDVMCGRRVARVLSPLLRVVCEPIPDFVQAAREEGGDDARKLLILFGIFSGTFARHVCKPIWTAYPCFAPRGWLL